MLFVTLGVIGSLIGYTYTQVIGGVDISGLPVCAQGCLENNTGSAIGCSITDVKCLCSSIPYINALSCCLEKNCDPADQESALAFDLALCDTYNISIPDFLGCSPLASTPAVAVAPGTTVPEGTTLTTFSMATVSTVTNIIPAFTLTSGGPTATFTGQAILTDSCTIPAIASYSPVAGNILEFPWVGCSPESPNCCPFPLADEGPLTVCPTDYFTTDGACCPSGWALLPTPLFPDMTPCYTTPALPLVPPTPTGSASTSPTIVSTQLFTLRYPLINNATTNGISNGAIAGIVVGSIAIAGIILTALLLWRRANARRKADDLSKATVAIPMGQAISTTGNALCSPVSPHNSVPHSPGHKSLGSFSVHTNLNTSPQQGAGEPIPELPSPPLKNPEGARGPYASGGYINTGSGIMSPVGNQSGILSAASGSIRMGSPTSQVGGGIDGPPRTPVMELPGSTFLHEHHPMYVGGQGVRDGGGG